MTRFALTFALLAAAPLAAQTPTQPATPLPPLTDALRPAAWSAATLAGHGKVRVVTLAAPGRRQTCTQPELSETTLTCKRHFHKFTLYNQADVAAILSPPTSDKALLLTMGGWLASSGGIIYGGVLLTGVALAGGIPVIVLGAVLALVTPVIALGADGDSPEMLLYQKPGTPLTITVGH